MLDKKSYKIRFNPGEKEQEQCINFFERAPQRNKLVSFAITEMINKYGLDKLSEAELKVFIKNYKTISKMGGSPDKQYIGENVTYSEKSVTLSDENGTFSQPDQNDRNGKTVTVKPERQNRNGSPVMADPSRDKVEESKQEIKDINNNKGGDISSPDPALQDDNIEINMSAFNQMKNLMGAFS